MRGGHGRPAAGQGAEDRCTSPTKASKSSPNGAGEEQVSLSWLAERLREFVDLNPEFDTPVDRLASWLARLDEDD